MAPHALVLRGEGRYSDPWHPFAETSDAIAGILRTDGWTVEVDGAVDERLAGLPDGDGPDLLVLNVGDAALNHPERADPVADEAGRRGLLRHVAAGRSVLGVHVAATSLRGVPEWEQVLGGVWVYGVTMHPEYGPAGVRVHAGRHPIVAGLADFTVPDERYTRLRVAPDVVPLATHQHDGGEHPLLWARTVGDARVVYDALGHDAASYDVEEHREIVRRAARWLARR